MAYRPQPVLVDAKSDTIIEEAILNVAEFFEQLLHIPSAHEWSLPGWLESRQSLQQADRIIRALL